MTKKKSALFVVNKWTEQENTHQYLGNCTPTQQQQQQQVYSLTLKSYV